MVFKYYGNSPNSFFIFTFSAIMYCRSIFWHIFTFNDYHYMEIQFTIVRSENKEYLCYKAGEAYVDASNPMIAFATGEDEFEIVEPDSSFRQKEYEFRGEQYYLVPEFYRNGWLALTLVMVEDEDEYIVLSVNLEEMDALGLPDRTFIDVNHYPEAMEFLVKNGLATDSEYKRRSGFVEYPMAMLNLPLLYQHNPQIFQKANIEPFGEECF